MTSHDYDDDLGIADDGSWWNPCESVAVRRDAQQFAIHMTQQLTAKVAPSYNGKTSFFAFKDASDDWCEIADLEPEKHGPALRNKLEGDAAMYRWCELFRYHAVKGGQAQTVFLHLLMQLKKHDRGSRDFNDGWLGFKLPEIGPLSLGWMALLPNLKITHPDAIAHVNLRRQAHEAAQVQLGEVAAATPGAVHISMYHGQAKRRWIHSINLQAGQATPYSDNLSALLFVLLASLMQDQRNTLTSNMTHRGRTLCQYNVTELKDLFPEMLCAAKTGAGNSTFCCWAEEISPHSGRRMWPLMEPTAMGPKMNADEEDVAEVFLDALEDVFWVFGDADFARCRRRFQGRQTRRGKENGKRKGKGKGQGGRRFCTPRKGKGRGKGKSKGCAQLQDRDLHALFGQTLRDVSLWPGTC